MKIKNTPGIEPSNLPQMPLQCKADVDMVEEILADEVELKNCIRKVSNHGGSNLRSCI